MSLAGEGGADRERLERIVEQFERAWRAGERPRIEMLLPDDAGRAAVLVELAHAELELRLKAGEAVRAAEYLERYPELAADEAAARELVASEQSLRRRLGGSRAGDPPGGPGRLGRFTLHEEVGRGSTGVVYRAFDTELDRVVAFKVVHPEAHPTDAEARRFLRGARYAARLRHPGIVAVHEVGRMDGVCYLVREFVAGATLADRMAAGRPDPREAAALVARLAEALDHAHRRGVIHRDVKPSNVLIDADGRPLLTDFDLARQDSGEATLTADGQLVGTPAYMSPEQARGDGRRADPRSDLYSLGVILYQLLTGDLPFRGGLRMVLAQIAEDDPVPPRRLNPAVPRDLETICLKAMAKEPDRRYPTAAALADDLARFLDGRPVLARPLGPVARLWRRCRRRPVAAGLTAALALSLAAGGLGVAWQSSRAELYLGTARREQEHARTLARRAAEVRPLLQSLSRSLAAPAPADPADSRQNAEMALLRSDRVLRDLSRDETYRLRLAQLSTLAASLSRSADERAQAVARWEELLRSFEELRAERPEDPEVLGNLARCHHHLALLHAKGGRPDDEARHLRQALPLLERVAAADDPGGAAFRRTLAYDSGRLGSLLRASGRDAEAVPLLRRAAEFWEGPTREPPARHRRQLASTSFELGAAEYHLGRTSEALASFRRAAELYEQLAREQPDLATYRAGLATCLHSLGNVLSDQGRSADAVAAYRRARDLRATLLDEHPGDLDLRQALDGTERRLAEALDRISHDRPAAAGPGPPAGLR